MPGTAEAFSSLPPDPEAYQLTSICGKGATSEVWLAQYQERTVAIKAIDLEKVDGLMDKAVQEAQVMHTIRHPHILPLLACFLACSPDRKSSCASWLWLVLPFMTGGSMLTLLQSAYPKGLDEHAVATVMKQVLLAVSYLHDTAPPVIHRDIKASNILIDAANGRFVLADLGVAAIQQKCFEADAKALCPLRPFLQRFSYVGSPSWMAPEVMEQSELQGHGRPADVYSIGITLLELSCGQAPYANLPFAVQAISKLHHDAPTLADMNTGKSFSAELEDLIGQCLARDSLQRPSASALLKHPFFKQAAKHPDHVVQSLLAGLPSLDDRLKRTLMLSANGKLPSWVPETAAHDSQPHSASSDKPSLPLPALLHAHSHHEACNAAHALDRLQPEHASRILSTILQMKAQGKRSHKRHLLRRSANPDVTERSTGDHDRGLQSEASHSWLPLPAFQLAEAVIITTGGVEGIGMQSAYGTAVAFARVHGPDGPVWSAPAYLYVVSQSTGVGFGDYKRERIVLFPTRAAVDRLMHSPILGPPEAKVHYVRQLKWNEQHIMEAVHAAKAEEHKIIGLLFGVLDGVHISLSRPYVAIHADHDANRRLYGRHVTPAEILGGRVRPPEQFQQLISDLRDIDVAAAAYEDGSD